MENYSGKFHTMWLYIFLRQKLRIDILLEVFFFFKIYLFERERIQEEGQRERESQADSLLSVEPDMGLSPMPLRS